jgi:uncharacterized protein YlxW (UPF0749 family)
VAPRDTLGQSAQELPHRAAAVKALQAKVQMLRTSLAQSEESRRETKAAAAVMQDQITSLRRDLAVAQQVGSAFSLRFGPPLSRPREV